MGASVENDHVVASLFEAVESTEKVEVITGDKIKQITPGGEKLSTIELESGEKYKARLLVGSDGMNSFTRQAHGISTWGQSYNQKGVVCTL